MDNPQPNLSKPFSIEAHEAGAKFCTRSGSKARILCTDLESLPFLENTPIAVAVAGSVFMTTDSGRHDGAENSCLDLFEVLPVKELIEEG